MDRSRDAGTGGRFVERVPVADTIVDSRRVVDRGFDRNDRVDRGGRAADLPVRGARDDDHRDVGRRDDRAPPPARDDRGARDQRSDRYLQRTLDPCSDSNKIHKLLSVFFHFLDYLRNASTQFLLKIITI